MAIYVLVYSTFLSPKPVLCAIDVLSFEVMTHNVSVPCCKSAVCLRRGSYKSRLVSAYSVHRAEVIEAIPGTWQPLQTFYYSDVFQLRPQYCIIQQRVEGKKQLDHNNLKTRFDFWFALTSYFYCAVVLSNT